MKLEGCMHRSLRVLVGLVSTASAVLVVASGCGSSESGSSSSGGTDPSDDGGTPSSGKIDAGSGTTDAGSGPKTDAATDSGNGDTCDQGSTKCTGDGGAPVCVDTKTDPANCGQCGKTCTADQECTAGACVDLCPTPPPAASFTSSPATIYPSTEVTFTPAVTTGVTYEWTFPSGTPATSTAQEPKVTWAAVGTYAVKLEITQGKCVQTTTTNVIVSTCAGSVELSYTGAVQDFVVPACVTAIGVDAYGAQGGTGKLENGSDATGGMGGRAQATVPVTGGETLHVFVGGMGQTIGTGPTPPPGTGGFNGGGDVFDRIPNPGLTQGMSGTGGGASDVRRGNDLADRLIVAGGGGGGGWYGAGGAGGGLTGADGNSSDAGFAAGKGGTQAAGGAVGWTRNDYPNTAGTLGVGGKAYRDGAGNGGGGGGYYGGGAGGFCGGAGGSSWTDAPGNTNGTTTAGVRTGNGRVVITW
jgi:PKD repeat protein